MTGFLVLRRENFRPTPSWREVDTVADATDAGDAFRRAVLNPDIGAVTPGEYMVVPLDGAWRVGAEITLRDLTTKNAAPGSPPSAAPPPKGAA